MLAIAALPTHDTPSGSSLAVRNQRGCETGECPGGNTNSFIADTLVLMADGSTRRIVDVSPGDQISATDPATGVTTAQPVVATIVGTGSKDLVEITSDAGLLTATSNHRFWVANRGGWHTAAELAVGDLLGEAGELRVAGLRTTTRPATVYNLDVTGPQTFTLQVSGRQVLVHE
ncbi:Hint domain-containing protein [Dactylosporangium sp. NPDC049525]|uniref:Hint domain-containing protein n=1 Tax=Dactylosporangium sp. NPDC049525 TaxID=3154730 RepID=UPI003414871C